MKIKTVELSRGALNWAVAMAEGYQAQVAVTDYGDGEEEVFFQYPVRDSKDEVLFARGDRFKPSTNWLQGGPILQRLMLDGMLLETVDHDYRESMPAFKATMTRWMTLFRADTPQEAAMRCYVGWKLGDEVDVPEALL